MRRDITLERALEENEALRQIIREAADVIAGSDYGPGSQLLERMRAAAGEK